MTLDITILALQLSHLVASAGSLALAGWLLAKHKRNLGSMDRGAATALAFTAVWSISSFAFGGFHPASMATLSLTYLAWLWVLYRLFQHDERDVSTGPFRAVVLALAFVELLQLMLVAAQLHFGGSGSVEELMFRFAFTFRLLFCVGALVLVHNLYAGAAMPSRESLRWPAAALATLWLYDLNLSTVAYLGESPPILLMEMRSIAVLASIVLLALGTVRHGTNLRFKPSRSFAFQSFSLLVIGGYLLIAVLVAQGLSYVGSDFARIVQAGFVVVAGAVALAVLPSRHLRGMLRVTISKHLFQHRYDYRGEWLRFTETIGRAGPAAPPLQERVVQAVADITDSPRGLLLTARDDGVLALDARWQWADIEVPAEAMNAAGANFFEENQFILDLDDLRQDRVEGIPQAAYPRWLLSEEAAWALVPLIHYGRLLGIVVLARPPVVRQLDWEDFDLLRIVGRQLASYLAEQASQDALGEAQRFDEFNRRIAFVMHDIKNLASQLSLLAKNAERHADNPEFRDDMLITLRNSAEKLQALLARLGRYGAHGGDKRRVVEVGPFLDRVAAAFAQQHEVVVVDRPEASIMADPEALEQALLHLVQNAIDASPDDRPVFLGCGIEEPDIVLEVIDSGCGMSPDFVRTRLFKPFHSSKPGGFGIGAFEAQEIVKAMDGRLDVESREGLGTRFRVRFPKPEAVDLMKKMNENVSKVA